MTDKATMIAAQDGGVIKLRTAQGGLTLSVGDTWTPNNGRGGRWTWTRTELTPADAMRLSRALARFAEGEDR